jgi:hypothetical protein
MAELKTFRNQIRAASPRWLTRFFGLRIMYVLGAHMDAIVDAFLATLRHKFPGSTVRTDSFAVVGSERKMIRGISESDDSYAQRLRGYVEAHKHRGSAYELLRQLYVYFYPSNFQITLAYPGGRFIQMDAAGVITDMPSTFVNGNVAAWAHAHLFYELTTGAVGADTWADGGTWDDGGVWDSSLTGAQVAQYRAIPAAWNAAHCKLTLTLLEGSDGIWDFPIDGLWSDPGNWDDGADNSITFAI